AKPEVRHPDLVEVGVAQGDGDLGVTVVLDDGVTLAVDVARRALDGLEDLLVAAPVFGPVHGDHILPSLPFPFPHVGHSSRAPAQGAHGGVDGAAVTISGGAAVCWIVARSGSGRLPSRLDSSRTFPAVGRCVSSRTGACARWPPGPAP